MRRPAQIKAWLSLEEMSIWVREAPTRQDYQKRLVIWLTQTGPFHAWKVADMLQVSEPTVWLWVRQYNQEGPEGLERVGRGGRRWSFLSWEEEVKILSSLGERASKGEILTAPEILPEIRRATGREVSLAYVYKLLHRHEWRKLAPRPHHVKADSEAQEEYKKNSRKSLKRR